MTYQEYINECSFLKKCSDVYYNLKEGQKPLISDSSFDERRKVVQVYELENDISEENCFSSLIGAPPSEDRVEYSRPMLSLENALTSQEADRNWITKWATKLGGDEEVVAEWKYDGMCTRLRYVDGKLVRALSRGDSEAGKDITRHAIEYVPKAIATMGVVEIDGETVMPKWLLKKLNDDGGDYSNCRNAVAGTLNRNEPAEHAENLQFYPFAGWIEGVELKTHSDTMALIRDLGFQTQACIATSVSNIQHTFDVMVNKYGDSLNFDIDGIVFKINSVDLQKKLGNTVHSPKWAFAYKRPPVIKGCTLLGVDFQVGRSGEISPVGRVTPTFLMGAVVSSVALHNEERMKQRGTAIGNSYEIYRSGDCIPHLGKLTRTMDDAKEVEFPSVCPACGSPTVKNGAAYYCTTPETCRGVSIAKIAYAVGREGLDIDGIGVQTVTDLFDKNRIRCAADILALGIDDLQEIGVSAVVAKDMVNKCLKARYSTPERFIISLSIAGVGKTTARSIVSNIFHLNELLEWKEEGEIVKRKIPGVGPGTAATIAAYFNDTDNFEFAKYLFGMSLSKIVKKDTTIYKGITGMTFVFSGSFNKGKTELEQMVLDRGGYVSGNVSSKTDYLVYGPGTGEKHRRAVLLKVTAMNEEEFLKMVDEAVKISYF